jgi:hypothetical protein
MPSLPLLSCPEQIATASAAQLSAALDNHRARFDGYHQSLRNVARWARHFSRRLVREHFANARSRGSHVLLLSNPCVPTSAAELLIEKLTRELEAGADYVSLRPVLGLVARRGGYVVSPELAERIASAAKASAALPDPLADLYQARVKPFLDARDRGVTDPREIRRMHLRDYRSAEVATESVEDQDPAGRALVTHPLCTPERALRLLCELPNEGLATCIGKLIDWGERPDYGAHAPLRERLCADHLHVPAVCRGLLRQPAREDAALVFDAVMEHAPEDIGTILSHPDVPDAVFEWLGPDRVRSLLASPSAALRLRVIQALPVWQPAEAEPAAPGRASARRPRS